MRRVDLIWRGLLVAAATAATLLDAPHPLLSLLVAASVVSVAERLVRLRHRGPLDALLTGAGGILALLVLVGLVLGVSPIGLHRPSWALALALVAVAALAVAARRERPARVATRASAGPLLRAVPWLVASVVVAVVAVSMAVRATQATEVPPVQMAFGPITGTHVQVVVRSSSHLGPLEMRTTSGGDEISYPLFTVPEGGSVTTTLTLPTKGRYLVTLNYPDQVQPLRSLTIDR